jgi:hypothetical protein
MSGQAEKILEVARSWLGYLEKKRGTYTDEQLKDKAYAAGSDNYTLFGKWYGLQGGKWCAMGLSYFAYSAGISQDIFPKFADCDAGMSWFINRKRFIEAGRASPSPTAGDVVFFGIPGDAQHVGLVDWVEDGRVFTIEGNTSSGAGFVANGGAVMGKDYPLNYAKILGYGRPQYKEDEDVTQEQFEAMYKAMIAKNHGNEHSAWADEAVKRAVKAGVFQGNEGNFEWKDPITREEMAVLFDRLGLLK